jgi:hypothetical protein
MKTVNIKIDLLETNRGQIPGVPKNPRLIKDERFEALKKSITDDPEMLELRECIVYPLAKKFVIIAGNMRFTACKELGHVEIPCKVLFPETTAEKMRAYIQKDNISFGENDKELLNTDWMIDELINFGLELSKEIKINDISNDIVTEYKIELEFKNEQDQQLAYDKLLKQGYICRILTL